MLSIRDGIVVFFFFQREREEKGEYHIITAVFTSP